MIRKTNESGKNASEKSRYLAGPNAFDVAVGGNPMEDKSKNLEGALTRLRTTDSYGAIVLRTGKGNRQEVLVIRSRHSWSFPKGHVEGEETPEETARRETKEETGIDISVDTRFCAGVPSARQDDHRTVYFFLGTCLKPDAEPRPRAEIREARWVACEETFDMIGYPPDREAFCAALKYVHDDLSNCVREEDTALCGAEQSPSGNHNSR